MPKLHKFQHVLCAVDFSRDSRAALRHAAVIARRKGGRLTVMYINDPLLAVAAAVAYDEQVMTVATARELRQFVRRAVTPEFARHVTTLVRVGDPVREIKRAARRLRADLIVIGTRGMGRAGRLFFGSTTAAVLHQANVPVLVVPHTSGRQRKPSTSWPAHILAAIELGARAASDARSARDVARWFRTHMLLVTVVTPPQVPSWLPRRAALERTRLSAAQRQLKALAGRLGRPAVSVRVLTGRVADQIASTARTTGSGLIVLQLRPADRLLGTRQGTITYEVLCRAAMPVLAVVNRRDVRQSGGR